jgi:hypothetical protein
MSLVNDTLRALGSLRVWVWFLVTATAMTITRLPFAGFQTIPGHLDFSPGIVIVPLAGVFCGPVGAWGVAAGTLFADWLLGRLGWISLFRVLAVAVFALGSRRLWDFTWTGGARGLDRDWTRALQFVFITWPGCFAAAAWQALGSELLKFYPFAYIVSLEILNHLLFCTLVGVPLYGIMARLWVPYFGAWPAVQSGEDIGRSTRFANAAMILIGAVGAVVLGFWISSAFYHIGPMQPFILGSSTGWGLRVVVLLLLGVNAYGIFGTSKK